MNRKRSKLLKGRTKYPELSVKERIEKKEKAQKDYRKDFRRRYHEVRIKHLGRGCFFCGRTFATAAHRKDGEGHKKITSMTIKEVDTELKTGNYVLLCYACHKGVHWSMRFLRMDWDRIAKKVLSEKDKWSKELNVNCTKFRPKEKETDSKDNKYFTLTCKCGNEFPIEKSLVKYRTKIGQTEFFCSKKCGHASLKKRH